MKKMLILLLITLIPFISSFGYLVDPIADIWVDESGDTMTGNLNMSLNDITDVGRITLKEDGSIHFGSASARIYSGGTNYVFIQASDTIELKSSNEIIFRADNDLNDLHVFGVTDYGAIDTPYFGTLYSDMELRPGTGNVNVIGNLTITNNVGIGTSTPQGKLHVGDATNYFKVANDGEITLYGTARVNNHVRVTAPSWSIGVSGPTEGYVGILPTLGFDSSTDDEVHYSLIIPYRMVIGSDITFVVDWTYTGVQDDGTVSWNLEYINIATGEAVAGSTATITNTTIGSHATGDLIRTTFGTKITGAVAHDVLGLRLYRDVSEDTLGTNAELIQTHFEFLTDKLGEST